MSTSSGPRTPPRDKSSPVGKVFLPENHEQYQKFGFDKGLLLGAFKKSDFFKFLDVKLPKVIPNVDEKKINKDCLITFANEVAKSIKDEREHYLFLYLAFLPTYDFHFRFPKARYPSVQRHGKQTTTWTRYGPNVQAQLHGCPSAPLEE